MKLDILAFGPHPDDVELFCAGTLMSHIKQGKKVGIVDLTKGELGTRGTVTIRMAEAAKAAEIMGVSIRENLGFADGFFANDQAHQLGVIRLLRKYQPDIVLSSTFQARHPDHLRGAQLVGEACFKSGLRMIETTDEVGTLQTAWRPKAVYNYQQNVYFKPDFLVDISDVMEQKIAAIKAYRSQFYDPNASGDVPKTFISTPQFLENVRYRASQLGLQIGVQYAESFTFSRLVGVRNLFDLI